MHSVVSPTKPTFRQEILTPLFGLIRKNESCVVAGISNIGKSRMLQHMLRPKVRHHYLEDSNDSMILVWVDCNRVAELSSLGLYELMLTSLVESVDSSLYPSLAEIRDRSIAEQNPLLAQRNIELATRFLIHEKDYQITFILDEFDLLYQMLDRQALASLRALRDMNKYQLGYTLFMREHPAALRALDNIEGFYELLSDSILYLNPYSREDAYEVIELIAQQRQLTLSLIDIELIRELSGGHPGLIYSFIRYVSNAQRNEPQQSIENWIDKAIQSSEVQEECRKIWVSIRHEEQRVLHNIALAALVSQSELESVINKGLILRNIAGRYVFFTRTFRQYVLTHAKTAPSGLQLDKASGIVWIDGKASSELTEKEYEFMELLSDNLNQICSNEEIITKLWPGDEGFSISSNSIAALVRRTRKKIEPNPSRPQYIISVKGRGYKLVDQPE